MKPRHDLSYLAHRLIIHAAHKAPATLAERLQEEWLADFEFRPGQLARLRLAIGCCWATAVIARDYAAAPLATSGASAAHKLLLAGLGHVLPSFSHRTVIFGLLAGFQILVAAFGLYLHALDASGPTLHPSAPAITRPQRPAATPAALDSKLKRIVPFVPDSS